MSGNRAEEIAAKARRLAERQQATAASGVPAVAHAAEKVLVKPVRSTLDLSPAVHRDFQAWLHVSAVTVGKARLTKQQVLEALVRRLLHDETLARKILDDLQSQ